MLKVLKSVLGFQLEWSKCQANKHHLVLWRLSPVPVIGSQFHSIRMRKPLAEQNTRLGDLFCVCGPDGIRREVLPEGRARGNTLAPITGRSKTWAAWTESLSDSTWAVRLHWKHRDTWSVTCVREGPPHQQYFTGSLQDAQCWPGNAGTESLLRWQTEVTRRRC